MLAVPPGQTESAAFHNKSLLFFSWLDGCCDLGLCVCVCVVVYRDDFISTRAESSAKRYRHTWALLSSVHVLIRVHTALSVQQQMEAALSSLLKITLFFGLLSFLSETYILLKHSGLEAVSVSEWTDWLNKLLTFKKCQKRKSTNFSILFFFNSLLLCWQQCRPLVYRLNSFLLGFLQQPNSVFPVSMEILCGYHGTYVALPWPVLMMMMWSESLLSTIQCLKLSIFVNSYMFFFQFIYLFILKIKTQ